MGGKIWSIRCLVAPLPDALPSCLRAGVSDLKMGESNAAEARLVLCRDEGNLPNYYIVLIKWRLATGSGACCRRECSGYVGLGGLGLGRVGIKGLLVESGGRWSGWNRHFAGATASLVHQLAGPAAAAAAAAAATQLLLCVGSGLVASMFLKGYSPAAPSMATVKTATEGVGAEAGAWSLTSNHGS